MSVKRIIQLCLVLVLSLATFATTRPAFAWSECGSTYVVHRGDSLSKIAVRCDTTVAALYAANPGIGRYIYAGQVLVIPNGYDNGDDNGYEDGYDNGYDNGGYYGGGTYIVVRGDTMMKIARRFGVSYSSLLAANPQIWNPSLIYAGQVVYLPAAAPTYYTVCRGDTLRKIAARYGTSVASLLALNPRIWNANLIYAGQVIRVY